MFRQTGRLDRYVKRSYLTIRERVSRHRVAFSLEEALRLAQLPGEDEGRIYCFRRISVNGVPEEASRRVWIEAVQQILGVAASHAVHGNSAGAGASNAIFFHNLEEALEMLLRHALLRRSAAAITTPLWYAASLLGVAGETSYDQQILTALELLRTPSLAPGSAELLFAALDGLDPALLLSAIPPEKSREWIEELDQARQTPRDALPLQLPSKLETLLRQAGTGFGWKDPRTLWLAVQAALCAAPSTRSSAMAAQRARSTLRKLEAEFFSGPRASTPIKKERPVTFFFDDEDQAGASLPLQPKAGPEPAFMDSLFVPEQAASAEVRFGDERPARAPLLGETTSSAGLFFLLNVLRKLGIVAAVEACPALLDANFAAHVLKSVSIRIGLESDDPILLCLPSPEHEFSLDDHLIADLQGKPACFPAGYTHTSREKFDADYLLRLWSVAIRRWCWRMGRLSLPEIVHRTGRVWLTRTEIDVTLPLKEVDICIRRVGLDIDPGWLPWFGERGRVVRFHYRDREPEAQNC